MVIVDPVMSSIGAKVDINRNNETREYIEPWARMAEAINGLVIGIVHLIKVPGGDIVAAINGSSAFGEVPRAVIAFAKDPQSDDGLCVLSQEKNNAGQTDLALAYTIESATVQTDDLLSSQVGRFVLGGLQTGGWLTSSRRTTPLTGSVHAASTCWRQYVRDQAASTSRRWPSAPGWTRQRWASTCVAWSRTTWCCTQAEVSTTGRGG